jgi:hypothetical protein
MIKNKMASFPQRVVSTAYCTSEILILAYVRNYERTTECTTSVEISDIT